MMDVSCCYKFSAVSVYFNRAPMIKTSSSPSLSFSNRQAVLLFKHSFAVATTTFKMRATTFTAVFASLLTAVAAVPQGFSCKVSTEH